MFFLTCNNTISNAPCILINIANVKDYLVCEQNDKFLTPHLDLKWIPPLNDKLATHEKLQPVSCF